jgi:hypothetical protein
MNQDDLNPGLIIPNIIFFKSNFSEEEIRKIVESANLNYYETSSNIFSVIFY